MNSESASVAAHPAAAAARLASLDAFRGFTMFWIVGGKSLLMALQRLGSNAVVAAVARQLEHSPWAGLRFYDVIWPAFMLMVGVSIPLSYAKRRRTQTDGQIRLQALKRAAILFLLGSLRTSVSSNKPTLVELSSALQPIALAYLVASFLAGASRKVQAAAGALILVVYALVLQFIPAPGVPAGSYENGTNLVRAVDLMVLGRTHAEGWGTVLSAIPTISTTILGLLIGQLLMSSRPARTKLKIIGLVGVGGVALGLALSPVVPVIMKLWTTSYGILSAGFACLQFLVFYWVIDVLGFRKWAFPFVIIGMNAVAIYMGVTLVPISRIVGIFSKPIAAHLGPFGALFSAAAVLLVEWLILYWMYKRKIFLRA
ncbi:MAG: hypothetical protein NTZ98_16920 [Acidobacteria bacterium]|nr:hypothetical protein [Acidobacteriota bacterium]